MDRSVTPSASPPGNWTRLPRPLRFLVVGAMNSAFGYCTYALLLWIGLHYSVAALLGTVIAVCFNFFMTGRLVFDARDSRGVFRFVAAYGALYAFNLFGLWLLEYVGIGPYLAGALLLLPMAALSFVLMRKFVFRGGNAGR